jgi:hypothetical protein
VALVVLVGLVGLGLVKQRIKAFLLIYFMEL